MKNSKYTFRCDKEVKERFKFLCRVGNVSPSDFLEGVMVEFISATEKIMEMEDIGQLRGMFEEKVNLVSNEIRRIEEPPTFEKEKSF